MRRLWLLLALLPSLALAQPGGFSSDIRAQQLFVQGMTRAYVHDYEAAVQLYEEALLLRPREAAVLSALAEAHEALGDLPRARYFAERSVEEAPTEPSVYRLLSDLQIKAGAPDDAVATLQSLVALTPHDPEALSLLARIQQQTGRLNDAIGSLEELLSLLGESFTVRSYILYLQQRTGDLEGALETAQALLTLDSSEPAVYHQLADLYIALGRQDDAVATLEALLETAPDDADAVLALAELYRLRGDEASASALMADFGRDMEGTEGRLAQAASLYARIPDAPEAAQAAREILETLAAEGELPSEALLMLGDLRYLEGDFPAAVEALAEALATDPGHPAAWARLATARLAAGEVRAAADAAEEGLFLFPGQVDLLHVAATAQTELGETRSALAHAEHALRILDEEAPGETRQRSALLGTVGFLHMRLDAPEASDAAYEEAIALDPDNVLVLNNFAYALAIRGERLDEAAVLAHRAVDLVPESPSFLDTLGWVYYARGEYDEAATWLQRAVATARLTGEPSAVMLEHLGDAEAARGRTEEAVRHWRAALERDPTRRYLEGKIEGAR